MGRRSDPKPRKKWVTRYELPGGKRVPKGTAGAKKVTTQTDSYYLTLPPKDRGGKPEVIALETTDESVAWKRVRDHLDRRLKEQLGIFDDRAAQAARPIAEHVEDWLAAVASGGVAAKRVRLLRTRVCRLIKLASWKRITDVKKSSAQAALTALADPDSGSRGKGSAGRGKGAGAQTRNHYLGHARQFTAWLVAEGRLSADPLAKAKKANVRTDRRHDRRVPDEVEVRVLFDHLGGAQQGNQPRVRCRMSGPRRALGYQVAMCAGLRAGELRRLSRESFELATGDVRITAASDKARKRRLMALPRWLCEKLAAWFDGGGGTWEGFTEHSAGEILQADLALARKGWLAEAQAAERETRERSTVCVYETASEDGPLYLDFHALRHWYITQAAATDGISPSTLMAMSRHVDPRMTLDVYAKAKREGVRHAVEQLPRPGG
jgi:integrase